ncbi:MAG TPA: thioredoxin [Ktedonobacterales bacterium]
MAIVTLTDGNFAEHVARDGVTLVDFWAPWCMPCRLVAPILERVAGTYEGKVTFGELNVDEQQMTAERFHISSIPTIGIFKNGKLINTFIGVRPEQGYINALDAALTVESGKTSSVSSGTRQRSVVVFSTPTCPWCSRLKAYLKEHKIAFRDVDVSRDTAAALEMVRRSGQMGVPQAWIDGQVVVGFDRARVDTLLGLPT